LGLGVWIAFGAAGNDQGLRPEDGRWAVVKSSIGEYGFLRDRAGTKITRSSPTRWCAGESDGQGCSELTGMPEPMTLLLFGAMLAGLGVVVRWGLRGRGGTSG
jgi:hypothetical protein